MRRMATLLSRRRRRVRTVRGALALVAGLSVFVCTGATTVGTPDNHRASAQAKTLVALGDSISFGYQLPGAKPGHPSPQAFPYAVGRRLGWHVINLSVPGYTSADLLRSLKQARVRAALRQANTVTIDIGSDDLLHSASSLLTQALSGHYRAGRRDVAQFQAALAGFSRNLPQIVAAIRAQTDAPIVLLDLYDPFPDGTILHDIAEPVLAQANQVVLTTAASSGCLVASAYAPFNHQQARYVRLAEEDVHPTQAGQQALAASVLDTLDHPLWHQPMFYAISPNGAVVRSQAVLASNGISWLHGDQADLVISRENGWLKVVTPSGESGYVEEKAVKLLLRPWNNESFASFRASVTPVRLAVTGGRGKTTSISGFAWAGWVYAPVDQLARAAGVNYTWDEATREARITSPDVAAWDLIGTAALGEAAGKALETEKTAAEEAQAAGATLAPGGNTAVAPHAPGPAASVQSTPSDPSQVQAASPHPRLRMPAYPGGYTSPRQTLDIHTRGVLIRIDGEATNLRAQPLVVNGRVYVPAPAFWRALGLPVSGRTTAPTDKETLPSFIRRFP
jgi:lysophospholipase L1-like esterase